MAGDRRDLGPAVGERRPMSFARDLPPATRMGGAGRRAQPRRTVVASRLVGENSLVYADVVMAGPGPARSVNSTIAARQAGFPDCPRHRGHVRRPAPAPRRPPHRPRPARLIWKRSCRGARRVSASRSSRARMSGPVGVLGRRLGGNGRTGSPRRRPRVTTSSGRSTVSDQLGWTRRSHAGRDVHDGPQYTFQPTSSRRWRGRSPGRRGSRRSAPGGCRTGRTGGLSLGQPDEIADHVGRAALGRRRVGQLDAQRRRRLPGRRIGGRL